MTGLSQMNQETERKRAWSAVKQAVHLYARDPSDKTAADVAAGMKSVRGLSEKSFWRKLRAARTDSSLNSLQTRRHRKD